MTPPWEYFENLNEVVYVTDVESCGLVYLNRYGRRAFGLEERDYLGKPCYALLQGMEGRCPFCNNGELEEGRFQEWTCYNQVLKKSYFLKDTVIAWDGRRYRMEFAICLDREEPGLGDDDPSPLKKFLDNYYFDADSFFRAVTMPGAAFYIYCGDVRSNVCYISDSLREDFGFSGNLVRNFLGQLERRVYEPDRPMYVADLRSMLEEKRTAHSGRFRVRNQAGKPVWLHCRGVVKWNADQTEPLFFSGSMVELRNESDVDPTTGLLNQSMALRRLDELQERDGAVTLLCVTLREYADINHVFGRDTGNAILREVSRRMEQKLGDRCSFFRLDGVKILAVARGTPDLERWARELRAAVDEVYSGRGLHIVFPCAIGTLTSQKAVPSQELIDSVTAAARMAKTMPGVAYLESNPDLPAAGADQKDMGLMLNHSINHQFEGFHIEIQPQVEADSGRICGGEALLRWTNRGQEVPPKKFIPLLEQNGLILPVGLWVMEQALKACAEILRKRADFLISVNVSYLQILDPMFFSNILRLLERYGVPAENLLVELTETHFDEMPDHLERFVRRCREVGIRFAIDDFGSAYSGLQLLLQYPADIVKLDRSLMCQFKSSDQKVNFIMSIIYACHRFGKKVCVEGVETAEELNTARQTGGDYIQGFYFYRPMALPDLLRTLSGEEAGRRQRTAPPQ